MIYINKTAVTEIKNSTSCQVINQAVKIEEMIMTHSEKNTLFYSTSDDYVNLDSLYTLNMSDQWIRDEDQATRRMLDRVIESWDIEKSANIVS